MSWLLKQAEDILNRVDQQANVALHQNSLISSTEQSQEKSLPDSSTKSTRNLNITTNRSTTGARRNRKDDDSDLIDYLNSTTPVNNKSSRTTSFNNLLSDTGRTGSSSSINVDETSKSAEQPISKLVNDTPQSTVPIEQTHDEDQGLVLNIPPTEESTKIDNSKSGVDQHEKLKNETIASLHAEIQTLLRDKRQHENDLQTYKRQQIHYQQQIAESDALLRDLRSRESDSAEALSAKDSQIALLRVRLAEADEILKSKTSQCEQLQNQCARILQDHTDASGMQSQAFDSLQLRVTQLEQELQQRLNENERLREDKHLFEKRSNDERQQLIEQLKLTEKRSNDERLQIHDQQQQTKHAKNLIHQLELEMNDYKAKAQRILQTKDKLITKLKEIVQHKNNLPSSGDQHILETHNANDDSILLDVNLVGNSSPTTTSSSIPSHWTSVQNEELKAENELFKQELQARELTIHTLRSELQEAELLVHHADEQLHEQTNHLNEQLKDERARLALAEQDYRKLKQELTYTHEEFHKQKQTHLTQLAERERELERLRSQLTSKAINHVNDDELEKRLQTLTESLIHKQTIIESLQTDKSSLTMQLERLEKRLDDYDKISSTSNNSLQLSSKRLQPTTMSTTIDMDNNSIYDNESDETLRYRIPLLRETPYDPDIAKKVKRAANELDKLGIRLGIFLKRYPAVRLGVIFYAILLHLWTLIVLFTYTPEVHGNMNPHDLSAKH